MTPFVHEVVWPGARCIGRAILIGAAVASALTLATHAARIRMIGESKSDVARLVVKKYALEAFPAWAAAHPDRACPRSLAELDEYMSKGDRIDPWGTRYHFSCGPHAIPRTAREIWVISAGEDRVFGTDDDERSDR